MRQIGFSQPALISSLLSIPFTQPAVAIGNVGQLAVRVMRETETEHTHTGSLSRSFPRSPFSLQADLLVASLSLPSRGLLHAPDLLPCLGADAVNDGPAALAGPAQLYGRDSDSWAVLQVRSPAAPGRAAAFAAYLAAWARSTGVASLLILGSVDARARRGADLEGSGGGAPRALVHRTAPEEGEPAAALAAKATTAAGSVRLADVPGDPPFSEGRLPPWPLLRECESGAPPLPALALLAFAAEADNEGDARLLTTGAAGVLGIGEPTGGWVAPRAWVALYG